MSNKTLGQDLAEVFERHGVMWPIIQGVFGTDWVRLTVIQPGRTSVMAPKDILLRMDRLPGPPWGVGEPRADGPIPHREDGHPVRFT